MKVMGAIKALTRSCSSSLRYPDMMWWSSCTAHPLCWVSSLQSLIWKKASLSLSTSLLISWSLLMVDTPVWGRERDIMVSKTKNTYRRGAEGGGGGGDNISRHNLLPPHLQKLLGWGNNIYILHPLPPPN